MNLNKLLIVIAISLLLVTPIVQAKNNNQGLGDLFNWESISNKIASKFNWDSIGDKIADSFKWNDIGESIAGSLLDFILDLINAPIMPLLDAVKSLLQEPINLDLFKDIWKIIKYTISLFYGLLFMWAGFKFIVSGSDPEKRHKAKKLLQNIIIMVILVNASFYIYQIVLEFNSLFTQGIFGLIDEGFFDVISGNLESLGLELFMGMFYIITLISTLLILSARYIIVAVGVAFFPIGLFLYAIDPVKRYGRLILNFLGITIFLTSINALILLISSQLVQVEFFSTFRIALMTAAFLICNIMMLYLMFFAAIKTAAKTYVAVKGGPVGKAVIATGLFNKSNSKDSVKDPAQKSLDNY